MIRIKKKMKNKDEVYESLGFMILIDIINFRKIIK